MEKRDISREEAAEIVEDVQTDADLALVCADCGATAEDALAVVAVDDPRDGERRPLCNECLSSALVDGTLLSPQQSRIVPLLLDGWATGEIADALEVNASNVSAQKTKISGKKYDALEQLERARSTVAVLEQLQDHENESE